MNKKLEEYSREELIEEIKSLKRRKKFGLVWEDKKEDIVEKCKNEIPVLKEAPELAINEKPGEPTNLIIEGDNFASLQVLNYTHHGKIDVIYIDPPYNTGNKDFIYNDSYVDSEDAFRHSKWLSFMERRLRLAKELLSDDGVIFISIDFNEHAVLRLLCDEIFGPDKFVNDIVWFYRNSTMKSSSDKLAKTHENILVYKKQTFKPYPIRDGEISEDLIKRFGKYANENNQILYKSVKHEESYLSRVLPKFRKENGRDPEDDDVLQNLQPNYLRDVIERPTIRSNNFSNQFNVDFSNPKNPELIKLLIKLSSSDGGISINKNAIILDFFAGSGTTGQAVLELNKEDGGNRKFILCTHGKESEGSEINISRDITYPRIKTVITGIRTDGSKYSDGISANVRYFTTDFIEKGVTGDATRAKLFEKSDEMIQVRENAFEFVDKNDNYTFYKNNEKFVAIIKDPFNFGPIWYELEEKNTEKLPVKLYVFSYSNYTFEDEIPDTDLKYEICAIPNSIMEVYRKISDKKEEK